MQNVKTSERLCLDFISMEGNEVHWFQFWCQTSKNASWDLGGVCDGTVAYRGERGTVYEEYIQDFKLLVSEATLLPEEQLMGYFFAGLRQLLVIIYVLMTHKV